MNVVVLGGRIGRDPETRHTQSGEKVVMFSLATDGRKKGETDWHTVVTFGQSAEFAERHFTKGASVLVQGRIKYEEWTAKDGTSRKATKVMADRVEFGGSAARRDDEPAPTKPGEFQATDEDVPF